MPKVQGVQKEKKQPKRPHREGEGRPSKYRKEYCESIIEFMSMETHQVRVDKKYYKNNECLKEEKGKILVKIFPTFERWCSEIGIHKDTMYEWIGKYPEFSDSYRRAKQMQEALLLENTMIGLYNPQFAMFMAKNNFGYKDKTETDITTNGESLNKELTDKQKAAIESLKKLTK